ncbi:hypothetical protein IMCC3317_04630 [Kordia antarctica]|uniref:Uncharacterized protein n=1 Tax=Kordia antarctica TaxID=1218801 RepID=A0A7L4ZEX0_9FLAO|nr:hypothetical protein IMCC3317_04630 [Kordia antarctica]
MNFPKFSPRIRKFLTKNPCYTAEKTKKHSEILHRTQVIYYFFEGSTVSDWILYCVS